MLSNVTRIATRVLRGEKVISALEAAEQDAEQDVEEECRSSGCWECLMNAVASVL